MKKSLKIIIILLSIFIILFLRSQTVAAGAAASERDKITERDKQKAINYPTLTIRNTSSAQLGFFYFNNQFEIITIEYQFSLTGVNENTSYFYCDMIFYVFGGFGNSTEEAPFLRYQRTFNISDTIGSNLLDIDYIDIDIFLRLVNENESSMIVTENSQLTLEFLSYSDSFAAPATRFTFSYQPFDNIGYLNAKSNHNSYSINSGVANLLNAVEIDAYSRGLNDAETFSFNFEWLSTIFDSLASVLNIEIFNGFRLWYLIGIPAFILLIYGVLKLFR